MRARSQGWRDFDPYDGLAGFGSALPERAVLARRVTTQLVMRTSPRLRWIVGVSPHQEAYSAGLLLSTASILNETASLGLTDELVDLLAGLRVEPTAVWGYGFPVTTRAARYGPTIPNAISTVFAGLGLADLIEVTRGEAGASRLLVEAVDWLASSLWDEKSAAFRYHIGHEELIYNASILCALLIARASELVGTGHLDLARRAVRSVMDGQRRDGSWPYAESRHLDWVDNHHTAFVLKALLLLPEPARPSGWEAVLDRGLSFFLEHLIAEDGAPKAAPDRRYPLDSLAAGQAVETLALAAAIMRDGRFGERAETVFAWTETHLRRGDSRYLFRRGRFFNWPGAYLRWGEVHVALGAARLATLHR